MKYMSLLFGYLLFSMAPVFAQSSIEPTRRYEGTVEYQKTQQHCTILDFNYPEKDMENALEQYVQKQGGKVKTNKGFFYAKALKLHNRENRYYDVYYKVTGSGKGDRATSKVYLILAEPDENILLRDANANHSGKTAVASVGAVTFFGEIGSEVTDYDLDKKIREQQEAVKKTERNLNDLEKRRQSLEKQMEDVRKDIELQNGELEKNKTVLAQFAEQKELRKKKN
jgi:hypothetical protein